MATSKSTSSKTDADKGAAENNATLADVKPDAAAHNATLADVTGDRNHTEAVDEHADAPVVDPGPGGAIPVYTGGAGYTDVTAMSGTVRNEDADSGKSK